MTDKEVAMLILYEGAQVKVGDTFRRMLPPKPYNPNIPIWDLQAGFDAMQREFENILVTPEIMHLVKSDPLYGRRFNPPFKK